MNVTGWSGVVWRASLRPLILRPRSSVLGILSVALGVAVFLAISIANRGAVESFHRAFEVVTGRADLEIRGRIPEAVFPRVVACPGVAAATPLVEAMVTMPAFPGETLHLIGIDPFSASDLVSLLPPQEKEGDLADWLSGGDDIALPSEFISTHGLNKGSLLFLEGPGAPRKMTVRYTLPTQHATAGSGAHVAAMDIATAQEWVGSPGTLSAILIRLRSPGDRECVKEALRSLLPADVSIDPPTTRTHRVDVMLSAFTLNLTALSLVSLMVGMFFVGNTAAASVVRRRVTLGILRAVGTGRGTIIGMVLAEAAGIGLTGSLLGVLLAPVLAGFLAAPVAQTVSSLYLPVDAHGGWPTWNEIAAGITAGVLSSMIAAWIPARQAASVDPTRVLHPGSAPEIFPMPSLRLGGLGIGFLASAWLISWWTLTGGPALAGFVDAFLVLAGFSLLVPMATEAAAGLVFSMKHHAVFSAGVLLRIAVEQTKRSLHRTAPTIAALTAAAAMTVGISVMIHSFRESVVKWAEHTLTADLFIAPAANELLGLAHTLPQGAGAWWAGRPSIKAVGSFREYECQTTNGEPVTLGVVSGPARGVIDFLHGDTEKKTALIQRGAGLAASESLARRLHLQPGSKMTLITPTGAVTLPVLDLYRDYTRDRGIAMIGAPLFQRLWGVNGVHSLAIEFQPNTSPEEMDRERAAFCAAFGGKEAFVCYSNRALKTRIVEIFDQTFAVTAVLKTISIFVAVCGVMLTLGILVLERARDIGVLRSMGASTAQVVRVMLAEAALIGVIASLVGILSGMALSLVLTWVINKTFFGWSIDLAFPWREIALLPAWMTGAALLAGFIPALQAAKISPAAALRME
jgi:putative ABC transport system permease protein